MFKRWIIMGTAASLACCFVNANVHAGLVDSNTSYGPLQAWDGFGSAFSPAWEGVTTVVDIWHSDDDAPTGWISDYGNTLTASNWNSSGIFGTFAPLGHWAESGGHWESRPTVRKVSSSSNTEALTASWLRFAGREFIATKNDYGGAEMARYAALVTREQKPLAEALAIAYRSVDFGDDEFSADGRVSAFTILNNVAEEAVASAKGLTWLEATYELDQDTDFSFELDMAVRGQIVFCFAATDVHSGEAAFNFASPPGVFNAGVQQTACMEGTLEAGTYQFILTCSTDAAVNSLGQWNTGGEAMFDLTLDLEEEYVQVWAPDHAWVSDNSAITCYVRFVDDIDATILAANWRLLDEASVPEPSILSLLILGGLGCLIACRLRK